MINCPKCNKELEDGTTVCDGCGAEIGQTKKKFDKNWIFFVIVIIIAAIVLGFVNKAISNRTEPSLALYVKDGALYAADTGEPVPAELAESIVNAEGFDAKDIEKITAGLGNAVWVSDNRDVVVYPVIEGEEGVSLYRKNITADTEAEKLDENIISYRVSETGDTVVYLKNDTGELFRYGAEGKNGLGENVVKYFMADDGSKVVYMDSEGGIYEYNGAEQPEKLTKDASGLYYVSEDFGTVYFMENKTLYKKTEGELKQTVAENVLDVVKISDDGKIYYTRKNVNPLKVSDYVIDAFAEKDAQIREPYFSDYTEDMIKEDQGAADQIKEFYTDFNDYLEAKLVYQDKLYRDSIREGIAEMTADLNAPALYLFDGEKEEKLADNAAECYPAENGNGVICRVYDTTTDGNANKINLTDILVPETAPKLVREAVMRNYQSAYVYENAMTAIPADIVSGAVSPDGKTAYVVSADGELYKNTFAENKISSEVIDTDVDEVRALDDSNFAYFKNSDGKTADLYFNGTMVANGVTVENVAFNSDNGRLYYMTGYDENEMSGVLNCFKKDKVEKSFEDVHTFNLDKAGNLVYMYEFDGEHGDLYVYRNGKNTLIDENVSAQIAVTQSEYRETAE